MNQMNPKNPNPYSNYGYTTQQGGVPQYVQTQQSGQQPNLGNYPQQQMPQSMQQMPQSMQQMPHQPMQTYMGGPLEASGGPLIPTSVGQFNPATNKKVVLGENPAANVPGMLEIQHAYLENIIRLNKGNLATVHLTFSAHSEQPNMVVRGNIIASGRDHLILLNPESNTYYVLLMVYVDYITFNEPIQTS